MSNTTVDPSYIPLIPGSPIWNALYEDYSSGLIGSWITILLCGIALTQAYNYFNDYPTDSFPLKLLVWSLSVLNLLHAAFEYSYLISGAGNVAVTLTIGWTMVAAIQMHVMIAVVVLLYFTNTSVKMLAGQKIQKMLLVSLVSIITLHFGFGTATVIELARSNSLWDFEMFKNTSIIPMVATQVAADVSVALSVCYALPRPSRQSFRHSREAIETLIVFTISRGILTSIAAIVELVGLAIGSQGLWFAAADYIIAGLYVNSFLASLNSRNKIRRRMAGIINVDTQLVSVTGPRSRTEPTHTDHDSDRSSVAKKTDEGKVSGDAVQQYDNRNPYDRALTVDINGGRCNSPPSPSTA